MQGARDQVEAGPQASSRAGASVGRYGLEQEPTNNNATEATLDEVSGDWIRDQLKGVPEVVPPVPPADQSQTLVLKESTPKEERGREDSVTELASALLDVTTR